MSCCVVNQSSLAIDARDPVELVQSIERLVGTWPLRAQIQETQAELQKAQQSILEKEERQEELVAVRLQLRPEVCKLVQCNELHTSLQQQHSTAVHGLEARRAILAVRLSDEVCPQGHSEG